MAMGLVTGLLAAVLSAVFKNFIVIILAFGIFYLVFLTAALRFSSALPGFALGTLDSAFDGWRMTRGQTRDIAIAGVLTLLVYFTVGLLQGLTYIGLAKFPGSTAMDIWTITPVQIALFVAQQWFLGMLSLSLITTLYGY